MKKILFLVSILCLLYSCKEDSRATAPFDSYSVAKKIRVDKGAVVSAHPLASEVGRDILMQGGNAVDAAIAVQYALAVVYPNAGNLGGGGFMVFHTGEGESYSIDFREKAPLRAHKDMYLDSLGDAVPEWSRNGHLASGVPGTVAGTFLAHRKFGKLPMDQLIRPAIALAERGFAITEREAGGLNNYAEDFRKYNTRGSAFVKEKAWKAGDVLVQKDLAETLKRIAVQGQAGFYEGKTAELIEEEMKRGGGIMTAEDLKQYEAREREPVTFKYKDYTIISMGLPSSGGIMMQQMLGMLEPYPISEYGFHSPAAIQLMTEIERRAFADRTEYMGDPDFVEVPVAELVEKSYLESRMADFTPGVPTPSAEVSAGLMVKEKEETTHLSVIDEEGNAVSLTTTINGAYGSRVVVGGAGFILNNEMDDFSAKPGAPNKFGLLGTEANSIQPSKRMLSAMTPTVVLKNDKPYLVLGTPGGSTIITSVFQTLVNILEFDLPAQKAVNAPKFHHQWQPDLIYVEKEFPQAAIDTLEAMGYVVEERRAIGRTEVIKIIEQGIEAVGDRRGDDSAAGY
ncbi:gamma-glutamyltransferase [Sinomicrobium soli]|uniref:gamma-glutamyltransferase n=1 Tax=Sinomicrobium sp. N-1-3-6 TaxID=2219864 RepID=UPI001EFFE5E1|nr:gamma-glutamyltransferase [Sinomicrobium sp. N-1-3-6]